MTLRSNHVWWSLVLGLLSFAVSASSAHAAEQLWTCGMHPQIIKHKPGNCPICGMKLTPIRGNAKSDALSSGEKQVKYYKSTMLPGEVSQKPGKDSMGMEMVPVYDDAGSTSAIQIDAATVQRMNLKTAPVTRGPVRREIRTVGSVTYNEEGLRDITTKYEGWIEKLFVNATWSKVKAGEPLFEIYSPDLYNAELNYLVARRGEPEGEGPLTRAALGRLQLFDVPAQFIDDLTKAGKPQRTFVFRATHDGVVIEKMAIVGQMMKPGERIYRMADLSSVWVLAQIYEQDLPFVREGQPATIRVTYGSERTLAGKVALLLPQVEEQTRAATARIVLPNAERTLRPGMFVDVRFEAQLADNAILVPEIAILRSGDRNTVFIAREGGTFEPREVKLGARSSGGDYEVLSGLDAGDRVVTSGQFMLDSESQLREAIQKMTRPSGSEGRVGPTGPPSESLPSGAPSSRALPHDPLTKLAFASADAAAALAKDDLDGYNQQREGVNAALKSWDDTQGRAATPLAAEARNGVRALPEAHDLKAAREAFEPFSTAVADLARSAHLHHTAGLHVFECPMAPATGKARWLQRTSGTKNPFFGTQMPGCGDEIDTAASSAPASPAKPSALKLPPGHPPIGVMAAQMSMKDFLHSQTGSATFAAAESPAGGEACGSCGMSAAQMAAGEPCAHDAATPKPAPGASN